MSIRWRPASPSGRTSTIASGKLVWHTIATNLGEDVIASAIKDERDWRHKYGTHVVAISESLLRAPGETAVLAMEAALAAAHGTMVLGESTTLASVMDGTASSSLVPSATCRIVGRSSDPPVYSVPFADGSGATSQVSGPALLARLL